MKDINIGFIGLGNLGKNLANSILLGGYKLFIHDLNKKTSTKLLNKGAIWCEDVETIMKNTTIIITCLPSPKAVSQVMESKNGIIKNSNKKHLIIECSSNDEEDVQRYEKKLKKNSSGYLEAPLSGGEWRSKKGNISVIVSGSKKNFKRAIPILKEIGYEIVYLGKKIGSASTIKVLTNYLASINLLSISEVYMISKKYNLNLKSVYKAIKVSSGNSFVHTSEGQLILSRSFNAQFTMDLICKDLRLVEKIRNKYNIPSKLIPLVLKTFLDGKNQLGEREFSTAITKLLEKKCNQILKSSSFPKILIDKNLRKRGIVV